MNRDATRNRTDARLDNEGYTVVLKLPDGIVSKPAVG
jgi:hypothetical protein